MIGKFCVVAALLFATTAAAQTSTTLNVPIIVTHGAPLTTFTFVNNTGNALPAGIARQLWAGIPLRRRHAGQLSGHTRRDDACCARRAAVGRDLDLARERREQLVAARRLGH